MQICDWPDSAKCAEGENNGLENSEKPMVEVTTRPQSSSIKPIFTLPSTTSTLKPMTTTSTKAPPAQGPKLSGKYLMIC